jgi:hypothetical protein
MAQVHTGFHGFIGGRFNATYLTYIKVSLERPRLRTRTTVIIVLHSECVLAQTLPCLITKLYQI